MLISPLRWHRGLPDILILRLSRLKRILADKLPAILKLLDSGEEIVEITG